MRYSLLIASFVAMCSPLAAEAATVLITGSNRGIGLELTKQYAEKGWDVIATSRSPSDDEDLQALAAAHSNIRVEGLDVTDHAPNRRPRGYAQRHGH